MSSKSKTRRGTRINPKKLRQADIVAHATNTFGVPITPATPILAQVCAVAKSRGLNPYAVYAALVTRLPGPRVKVLIVGDTAADVDRVHQLADELVKQLELT